MTESDKTREELMDEAAELHRRIVELERTAADHQNVEAALRKNELRYRRLFESARDGIVLLSAKTGHIIDLNQSFLAMSGHGPDEFLGKTLWEIRPFTGTDAGLVIFKELQNQEHIYYDDLPFLARDGSRISVEIIASAHTIGSERILQCTVRDISKRKAMEDELRKAESRNFYLTVMDELPNPIRRTDADGKCDYVNRAWLAFTGRTIGHEVGDAWTQGVHPEDLDRIIRLQVNSFKFRTSYVTEYRLRNYNGEYRWVVEFGRPFEDIDGSFAGYISSCYDVQERKTFEKTLQSISTTDDLTGLLNRRGFFSLAQQQLKVANRTKKGFLLFYVDFDGLKKINDMLGHPEGDLALVETATVLKEIFRESDIIGRLGGDEFAVLMPEHTVKSDEDRTILTRINESIRARNAQPGRRYTLSISIGMKFYDPESPCSLDELISRADSLMYQEKELKYRAQKSGS